MPHSKDQSASQQRASRAGRLVSPLVVGALALSVGAMLGTCRERSEVHTASGESHARTVEERQLEIGVSGCSGLVQDAERGLVCLTRKPKPLNLWLDGGTRSEVALWFDGVRITAEFTIGPDGLLITATPPMQRGQLRVHSGGGVWSVTLVPVSDDFEHLRKQVQASWKAGDAAAIDQLERQIVTLKDEESALLICLGARLALAAGDTDLALTLAARATESSTVSCVGRAALLLAYIQLYLRPDFNAAEQSLRAADAVSGVDLDTRIGAAYLRGVLEHRLGQVDESLLSFEHAARLAGLVGDEDQYASARVMEAVSLARLGRFEEAEALAREVEAQAPELEHQRLALDLRSSLAWITVLRREDDPSVPSPAPELRDVIKSYALRNDVRNVANRRLDLAATLVEDGEFVAAAAELAKLDPEALDPDLQVWFELTTARWDLAQGAFDSAETHLERAALFAELNQDRELEWRVATTRGELERSRGDDDAAIYWFTEASHAADELAMTIAGEAGRSRFVTTHSRADLALVEMLLEVGRDEAAMCVAMAARARHFRGLWARLRPPLSGATERRYRDLLSRHQERKQAIAARLARSWELSTAELQILREQLNAEGERADELLADATALLEVGAPTWSCERSLPQRHDDAVLTMAPKSDGRTWTIMLARRNSGKLMIESVDVELAGAGAAESVATAALEEFASSLEDTRILRVIPIGLFVTVDFHRLWLALGKTEPTIVYSLGLGIHGEIDERGDLLAAVVAGSSDLAAVAQEKAAVGERLRELDWVIEPTWSPSAVAHPRLLHYAGHASGPGKHGWRNAIEIPGVGRVTAAQVVASQRSPEMVVLGACSAGRVSVESIDGGMNLAAAFLLAGARLVIAPTRDVDDYAALELGRGLYRKFDANDPESLARSLAYLQSAQLEEGSGGTGNSELSFGNWRAWVP